MTFQIGDKIIHRNYGPGEISGIEEKQLGNKKGQYYVVVTHQVTLWVPIDATENSIRPPTARAAFQELLTLLKNDGNPLPEHHNERQEVLALRMQTRSLPDICDILRDLASLSRNRALNRKDNEMMRRAQDFLLNEWEMVLGTPRTEARLALAELLQISST